MPSIKARIEALTETVRKMHPTLTPYEALDPLSQSIVDVARELEALDTAGKRADYWVRHGLDADGLEAFIRSFTTDY